MTAGARETTRTPSIRRAALVATLCIGWVVSESAQDQVRLTEGGSLKGEIVAEDDARVVLVTLLGERIEIDRATIEDIRRAGDLDAKVAARLASADPNSAPALVSVAAWAESQKRRSDARRLALRALGIDPENAKARALLGHVKALGEWYGSARDADAVVRKVMTAEGRRKYLEGYALPAEQKAIKKSPDDWMLDGPRWRAIAEVMAERGNVQWEGEWYGPDDQFLIDEAKKVKTRVGRVLHGGRVGPCWVFCESGVADATEIATSIFETRSWFMDSFAPQVRNFLVEPISRTYVAQDEAGYRRIAAAYRPEWMVDERFEFFLSIGNITLPDLSHGIYLGAGFLPETLSSAHAHEMLAETFGSAYPSATMMAAASNLACLARTGQSPMHYIRDAEWAGARSEAVFAATARAFVDQKGVRIATDLLGLGILGEPLTVTAYQDAVGVAALRYLISERRDDLSRFVSGGPSDSAARVQAAFGATFEEMDQEIAAWFEQSDDR